MLSNAFDFCTDVVHLHVSHAQEHSVRIHHSPPSPKRSGGWRKDQLVKVYKAVQLSILTHAAPAWQPLAAPSRIEQLEHCQNKPLRVVTGQLKSTLVETLWRKAGICSIATADKSATVLAYEKAHRLPPDHPRRQILAAPSRHRLKRPRWRFAAQASTSHLPAELAHRALIDSRLLLPLGRFMMMSTEKRVCLEVRRTRLSWGSSKKNFKNNFCKMLVGLELGFTLAFVLCTFFNS